MSEPIKRLSDAELEIMLVLWSAAGPVPSTQIRAQLIEKRRWQLSTLMSVLERLAEKGYVRCDRSTRTNLYGATLTESEYKAHEGKTVLGKLYGNSLTSLVTNLYAEKAVSDADIEELRAYLARLNGGQ